VAASATDSDGLLARTMKSKDAARPPTLTRLPTNADVFLFRGDCFERKGLAGGSPSSLLGRDVSLLVACATHPLTVGYRPFPPSIWGKAATIF